MLAPNQSNYGTLCCVVLKTQNRNVRKLIYETFAGKCYDRIKIQLLF